MKDPLRPPNSARHQEPRKTAKLLLWALLGCLVCGLALPVPSQACAHPPDGASVNIWIIINGNQVWIKVRGFSTVGVSPDPKNPLKLLCGCGINLPPTQVMTDSVAVVDDATQQVIPGFHFALNSMTASNLPSGFVGFAATLSQSIPVNPAVDLSFHGTLGSGATFQSIKAALEANPQVVTSGETGGGATIINPRFPPVTSIDPTQSASNAPSARVASMSAAASGSVVVNVQDPISGLSSVSVAGTSNATASVSSFPVGTTGPVAVAVSVIDERELASARITACNQVGSCSTSQPVLMPMEMGTERLHVRSLTGFDPTQTTVFFQNGDPGVNMLSLFVNGQRFSIRPLTSEQRLELDLALASQRSTTLTCAARGEPGAQGLIVLWTGK